VGDFFVDAEDLRIFPIGSLLCLKKRDQTNKNEQIMYYSFFKRSHLFLRDKIFLYYIILKKNH